MKLRTNLLRTVLIGTCMLLSWGTIALLSQTGLLEYKNLGLAVIFTTTLITVVVVMTVPDMVKQKYNLK